MTPSTAQRKSELTAPARFWAKVQQTDTCWLWTAKLTTGLGRFPMAPDAPTTVGRANRPTPPATAARRRRLLVAYLVVVTVVGYLTVGVYALSVVGFTLAFALLLVGGVAVIDRRIDRRLKRHLTTARDVPYLPVEAALRRHPASRARRRLG